jgi:AhpD family alkylhydroperoxidase
MQARIKNPVFILPDALKALHALNKSSESGLPPVTRQLVHLRASQINGCSVCVDMHARELRRAGQSDERLFTVAEAARHYDEAALAALVVQIALINTFNRINVATRQISGDWVAQAA